MSNATRRPTLGPSTGDRHLIERIEPLVRAAGIRDRISVVHIDNRKRREAHFAAGLDTEYEIGSLTKTMTSLLFADAVNAGALTPETTAGSLLNLGNSHVASVTLEELASHRSGLPRIVGGLRNRAKAIVAVLRHRNPYTADIPTLLDHAKSVKITARGHFSYSNLGIALLGQALAAHAGIGYPDLLQRDLFAGLDMAHSTTPLTYRDLSPGAATGWNAHGNPEQAWAMGAFAPAGGVRSTPFDMARYAQALLDHTAPGLAALQPRWEANHPTMIGYSWFTERIDGVDVTWHNGTTGGFSSMLALDRDHGAAVVVLANTAVALDDIAMSLLIDPTHRG